MRTYNLARDGQAQTERILTVREKGVEDPASDRGGYSTALILNGDDQDIGAGLSRDGDLASTRGCLDGVHEEVEKHLADLVGVAGHGGQVWGDFLTKTAMRLRFDPVD